MTEPNPYAAPLSPIDVAPTPEAAKLEKARRTNLINRRSVALLLELAAYTIAPVPIITFLIMRLMPSLPTSLVGWVTIVPFYVLRDVTGPASFGKRLVGLGIAGSAPQAAPSFGARI